MSEAETVLPKYNTYEERRALSESPITLDGFPARLIGFRLDYPLIESKVTGEQVEFAWRVVARVIAEKGGAFKSGAEKKPTVRPTQKTTRKYAKSKKG